MSDLSQTPEIQSNFASAFARLGRKRPSLRAYFSREKLRRFGGIFLIVGIVLVLLGGLAVVQVRAIKQKASALKLAGNEAYDALKAQNITLAREKLTVVNTRFDELESQVMRYQFVRFIPFFGLYMRDAQHAFTAGHAGLDAAKKLLNEIEPYADVLGFKGQGSFTGGSAQERIAKILETLQKITPALDAISSDMKIVSESLSLINENRYPQSIGGTSIRPRLVQAKSLAKDSYTFLTENRKAVELLPEIAGATARKKYLVLFQNSGELRPTGGFLTAYAVINVDKGKVEPEGSGDIYELDQRFTNKPEIPAILKRFLTTESRWNLRDMNLSPDFRVSMEVFHSNYQKIRTQRATFDGIIAVDTHFLESLVKVIGPVQVPGFGTFTADNDPRCDCPHIIYALSEIIDRPTPYIRENRKGILGPMMAAILQKSYDTPKNLWPMLFQTGWKDIEGKHVLMYFFDPKLQDAAEAVNAAGRVKPTAQNSDYFLIVDTNLAGAKSNFFVQSEIEHAVSAPANGLMERTVTVAYKNPFKASNCNLEAGQLCLNGVLQDWVRIYLPAGAKLKESRGFDEGSVKESEDLEHAVIEGTFRLQPLSQAKIEVTYTVPYTNTKEYSMQLQKQGGTEDIKHIFDVNGNEQEVILDKDKTLKANF